MKHGLSFFTFFFFLCWMHKQAANHLFPPFCVIFVSLCYCNCLIWNNRCELIGANLEGSVLDKANLQSANLQGM